MNMEQAPYPPLGDPSVDNIAVTAQETLEALKQAHSLRAFIDSRQRSTLGTLPGAVQHPEEPLIRKYVDEGIPLHTVPAWIMGSLERATAKGPHAYTCTPKMTAFICGEMRQRVQDRFSIILSVVDAARWFGEKMKL